MGVYSWLKNLLLSNNDVKTVEHIPEESFNYFLIKYDTNLCGINKSYILKTTKSRDAVEDNWYEWSNENAMDYVDVDEVEDLEIYASVEEIDKSEYLRLKEEEHYSDWA